MAESTNPPPRPPQSVQEKINDKLSEAFHRVNHLTSALLFWDRLTDQERQSLYAAANASSASAPANNNEDRNYQQFSSCFRHFRGTVGMWMHLRAVSRPRAVIQLARELNLMSEPDYRWLEREISKTDPPPPADNPPNNDEDLDEKIERARNRQDLVLVQGNGVRQIYWRRQLIVWGRHPVLWELLWELGERAKAGQEASWDTLSNRRDEKTITRRRWQLKKLLPSDLNATIKPGDGVGTYKLALDPQKIALFELAGDDWIIDRDRV